MKKADEKSVARERRAAREAKTRNPGGRAKCPPIPLSARSCPPGFLQDEEVNDDKRLHG